MKRNAGVIGWPIEHSLSPAIHQFWLKQYRIEGGYEKLAVKPEELSGIIGFLEENQLCGINVTIPHKTSIIEYLDDCDDAAKSVGAVNTVIKNGNKWIGCNTDIYGFGQNLYLAAPQIKKESVLILGAGGAARAAIKSLQNSGFKKLAVCNRTASKSKKIAEEFGIESKDWQSRNQHLLGIDLLVNTTSLGMKGAEDLPLELSELPKEAIVYDIVYNPKDTQLLKAARARGNKTIGGLGMLLHQAAPAFCAWFGVLPQVDEQIIAHVQATL